jgi:class 3 adenylate cyclase
VVRYSRLMGADEEGTHEHFKTHLRELVDPNIREHRGRVVKTTGDGVLAEFASVVDAVRCAVEVQQAMPEQNTSVVADSRIELRIGINLGDVIVEGDDLYGDGVNIAARVEALADAGGSRRMATEKGAAINATGLAGACRGRASRSRGMTGSVSFPDLVTILVADSRRRAESYCAHGRALGELSVESLWLVYVAATEGGAFRSGNPGIWV